MISAVTKIMATIRHTIPSTILEAAFRSADYTVSIDKRIIDKIITDRVLVDVNATCGKLAKIPILLSYRQPTLDPPVLFAGLSRMNEIYEIPAHAREGRNIGSVVNMSWFGDYSAMYPNAAAGFFNRGNNLGNLVMFALNSRTYGDVNLPPKAVLLAGNMIRTTPPIYTDGTILNCLLEYDEEFTNLSSSSLGPLTELALCATKIYIYNTLVVNIDLAALSGGQILGVVKQIVDGYSEEWTRYNELLDTFRGSTIFDPELSGYIIGSAL